jgi:hypothetical protein
MYIVFEVVGGIVVWVFNGCKQDYKQYQTGPGDTYGKRVKRRIYGLIALTILFNSLLFIIKKL